MKLRKLVLSGFKSFADRTEFVFDRGVSAIVGPNGCGKSNIVDAFKWVLGEQSAKSLRGSEMMDVIFNGCATRKAAGHAEVTLEFDNTDGVLQPQAAGEAQPGETVLGKNFATFPGGKGANQAVAAARLGAKVSLIGRVGQDAFGDQLLASAKADGINVSHVGRDDTAATGVAMITVDERGQNSIAVASGANFRLTADHVRKAWTKLDDVDILVMPLETLWGRLNSSTRVLMAFCRYQRLHQSLG